ncbi:MAG: hypothetical protein IJS32_01880 [Kiritimatiellae bacterium]|nr:hypothetical protein [Kiritimatiellia bacterium]
MSELVQPLFTPEGLRRIRVVSGPAGSGRTTRLKMLLVDARRAGLATAGFLAERDARGRRKVTDLASGESRLLPKKEGARREKALAFVRKSLTDVPEDAVVFIDETASGGAADERTARAGWALLASGRYKSAVIVLPEAQKQPKNVPFALPGPGNLPNPPEIGRKSAQNGENTPPVGWIPPEKWGQATEIREIGQVPPPRGDVTQETDEEAADERARQARERWAEKLWEAGVKDEEAVAEARKLLAKPEKPAPETPQKAFQPLPNAPKSPENGQKSSENAVLAPKTAENGEKTSKKAPEAPQIPPDFLPGGGADVKTVLKALELLKTGDGNEAKEALAAPDACACLDSLGLGEKDILQPLPSVLPRETEAPAPAPDPYALPSPPGEPPRRFAS